MVFTQNTGVNGAYRYLFNGMEKDDEIAGKGNGYYTFFRGFDPRLGRWKSIDPKRAAWETPYSSMANNPIWFNDVLGDSVEYATVGDRIRVFFKSLFNREFRERHNERKSSLEVYTYRLVTGAPDLENAREVPTINSRDMHTSAVDVEYSLNGAGFGLAVYIPIYWVDIPVNVDLSGQKEKVWEKHKELDEDQPITFSKTVRVVPGSTIDIRTYSYPDNVSITSANGTTLIDAQFATGGASVNASTTVPSINGPIPNRQQVLLVVPNSVNVINMVVSTTHGLTYTDADSGEIRDYHSSDTMWRIEYIKRTGFSFSFNIRLPVFWNPDD